MNERPRDLGAPRRCRRPSSAFALKAVLLPLSLLVLCAFVAGCSSSSAGRSAGGQSMHPGVRLELRSDVVQPGRSVWFQIVNTEAAAISFGIEPRVEALRHGRWVRLPITRHGLPVVFRSPEIGLVGTPARWKPVEVPTSAGWVAGKYRLRQDVTARFSPGHSRHLQLTHYFRLTPG